MAKKLSKGRRIGSKVLLVFLFLFLFVCLFVVKSFLVAEEFWSTFYLGHGCRTLKTTYSLPEFGTK